MPTLTVKLIGIEWVCPAPKPVTNTLYVPTGVTPPTEIVKVDEPEPGAAIEAGLKLAVVPAGRPEVDSETKELKSPERVEVTIDDPAPLWGIDNDDADDESEKCGPKLMSMTGCSSMPLGAMPSCPSK